MNDRSVTENDLHQWIDHRLDPVRAERVQAWLATHPEEHERVLGWGAQKEALHQHYDAVLSDPIPSRLLDAARTRPHGLLARFDTRRIAAAVAWLAIGTVFGMWLRGVATPSAVVANLPRDAAVAYAVYVPEVLHPVEVAANQEAHLATWLSKRLGEKVSIPKLDASGFALVGGRLLPGNNSGKNPAVAQFMYQNGNGQRLTLYVRNDDTANRETAFRYAREGKVDVFYWIDGPFGYALAGEVGKDRMLALATEVYRQINP
jgi:anti-sigma factor RsiW